MSAASIVFPHQLFDPHRVRLHRHVVLIEDELFFSQYRFNKKKLVLHRASLRAYSSKLENSNYHCHYYHASEGKSLEKIFAELAEFGVTHIRYTDTEDYLLERRINRHAGRYLMKVEKQSSPNFICAPGDLPESLHPGKRHSLTSFYQSLRQKTGILYENGKPIGGKLTFDTDNRKKLPKDIVLPKTSLATSNKYVDEAKQYVQANFAGNYGDVEDFDFPVDATTSKVNYDVFLDERFSLYGPYQDAIHVNNSPLFHSLLTPSLNIGLVDPQYALSKAIEAGLKRATPVNSLEGFVRQILGWREFVRLVYRKDGVKQRTSNFFTHRNPLPSKFYTASTGIEPVDNVIRKAIKTGYTNHIERLMVMGNFMLLCEIDPDHVYRWFMELYIDAYDWVMVPNVYGMSQFADGGHMSTKPYISGSNYILKMSNFKPGPWCEIWDALYWCFIEKHKKDFAKNPRMAFATRLSDKIPASTKNKMQKIKDNFLCGLY